MSDFEQKPTLPDVFGGLASRLATLERLFSGSTPQFVDVLPSSPGDGLDVYFQNADMATRGEAWHLRYREAASGSYKWEFVGGSHISASTNNAETTTSTSYVALTTPLAVTLPLEGDYDIEVQATIENGTNNSWASYAIGVAAASDNNAAMNADSGRVGAVKTRRQLGVAANTSIAAQYKVGSGTGTFRDRVLRAVPVRVG